MNLRMATTFALVLLAALTAMPDRPAAQGDLPLAIGLGVVLVAIVVLVNAAAWGLRRAGERFAG